jgi:hypothetical protein
MSENKANETRLLTVRHCARCDEDHTDLEFTQFRNNPIEDTDGTVWNWWAMCPVTNEPILMKINKQ